MDTKELIATLNELIETCEDGEQGFRTCSEDETNTSRKVLFMDRALLCAESARQLQQLVRDNGGDPAIRGTLKGSMHRRWIDVKAALMGTDDKGILAECERGEDAALQNYREALRKDLPSEIRCLVERQYDGILHNRNMVARLRNQAGTSA